VNRHIALVLDELGQVFQSTESSHHEASNLIIRANRIVTLGAGRVGLVMDAFSKRLVHLGLSANSYSDVTLPRIGKSDLLIIGSGSGNTPSIVTLARIANVKEIPILLFTSNPDSEIAKIALRSVVINAPNKDSVGNVLQSKQPMTTLFEQSLFLWLDSLVLYIMNEKGISAIEMKERHNELE
jgi:6-phospho-3-hexuloisomerase